jgi:hypothetical protein
MEKLTVSQLRYFLHAYGDFVQTSLSKKEALDFEKALDKSIKKSSAYIVKSLTRG